MSNTIVTHLRPDLDACAAIWLVKKFFPGFEEAELAFVPAGKTLNEEIVDTNPHNLHVDTGKGKFDHHHLPIRTSAAQRIVEHLISEGSIKSDLVEIYKRFAEVITIVDNFEYVSFPLAQTDSEEMMLYQIIEGYAFIEKNDFVVVDFAERALDGFLIMLLQRRDAEEDLKKGEEFTVHGNLRAIAVESRNEYATHFAQKKGYSLVIRKDPKTGRGKIKARPDSPITLENVWKALGLRESPEIWYFHQSGKMVINGSDKNPTIPATKLSLSDLIKIVKENA